MANKIKKLTVNFKVLILAAVVGVGALAGFALYQGIGGGHASAAVPANFVYRSGNKLMLNGSQYKFVGYNAFGMFGCEGSPWTRAQFDAYFAALPPASMTRIWAAHLYGTGMIDQAVASAEAHNQKIIMTLGNDTGDCVDDDKKNIAWYTSGYKSGNYLGWVNTAVTKYKNSPAVGMWEVINEAGQIYNSQVLDGTMMKNFYQDVASRIKAIDPNHLVSTGDNGDNNYIGGASGWKTAGGAADIDVLSIHDYASDYGGAGVMSPSWPGLKSAADSLSKPVIIGEINDKACSLSKTTRAANVKNSIDAYLANGAAGAEVWNFSQSYYNFCAAGGEDYIIVPSDPLYPIIKNYSIPGNVVTPPTTGGGGTTPPVVTGCTVPSNYGTVTNTISVPSAGTYKIWSRITAPDSTNNSYSLDIDGTSCVVVGDSTTIPANAWTWVGYKSGSTTTPITMTLSAGTHTFKLVGREANVKVDRILALSDQTCVPTGTGNNCTASADATLPVTNITAPANGSTVNGTVSITATATDNIGVSKVEFYIDNTLKTTVLAAPFSYSWNTAGLTNGTHTISLKAYDAAGNMGAATSSVTTANGDTQAPAVPTNVQATANTYNKVTVTWGASTDNVGVAKYIVVRNNAVLAEVTSGTSYSDTTVAPSTQYSYQVSAYDAAGNKSALSAAASVKTPTPSTQDTQAPTAATGLLATPVSTSQINLTWTAATDNVGVVGYDVYRAAVSGPAAKVATVSGAQFGDSGLQSNALYTYYVVATDAAGNRSAQSVTATATTKEQEQTTQTGSLQGVVTNRQGKLLSGVRIIGWSSEGKQYNATTNTSGVYRFDNLPTAYYMITFHASGYYDQRIYPSIVDGQTVVKNIQLSTSAKRHWWQLWR
jgi:chitodextrinase